METSTRAEHYCPPPPSNRAIGWVARGPIWQLRLKRFRAHSDRHTTAGSGEPPSRASFLSLLRSAPCGLGRKRKGIGSLAINPAVSDIGAGLSGSSRTIGGNQMRRILVTLAYSRCRSQHSRWGLPERPEPRGSSRARRSPGQTRRPSWSVAAPEEIPRELRSGECRRLGHRGNRRLGLWFEHHDCCPDTHVHLGQEVPGLCQGCGFRAFGRKLHGVGDHRQR